MRPGPATVDEFRDLSFLNTKDFFAGDGGTTRQHRAFAATEHGVALHEDFAGRQGIATGIATAIADMQRLGLQSDGLLIWRISESSGTKRQKIEQGTLPPKHSYSNVKDISLSQDDADYISKHSPKLKASDDKSKPALIDDGERSWFHHMLQQYFQNNEATRSEMICHVSFAVFRTA